MTRYSDLSEYRRRIQSGVENSGGERQANRRRYRCASPIEARTYSISITWPNRRVQSAGLLLACQTTRARRDETRRGQQSSSSSSSSFSLLQTEYIAPVNTTRLRCRVATTLPVFATRSSISSLHTQNPGVPTKSALFRAIRLV